MQLHEIFGMLRGGLRKQLIAAVKNSELARMPRIQQDFLSRIEAASEEELAAIQAELVEMGVAEEDCEVSY